MPPLAWSDGDFISSYKLNTSTYHRMTGLEMEALTASETVNGMQVYCTQTSSVYTAGKHYRRALDNNSFEVVGLDSHTHLDDDSGGRLADTLIANIPQTVNYDKRFEHANAFWTTVASGGTVADDAAIGAITLSTSATNGGRASLFDGGAQRINFAYPSAFESHIRVPSATNYVVKLGIEAEAIEASNNTIPKYGIEGCSTTGSVWLVFSANGSVRSTLTTAQPVVSIGDRHRLECTPATSLNFTATGVLAGTKTTHIPSSGNTNWNSIYRAGIKNSAPENKQLFHYGGPIIVGSI